MRSFGWMNGVVVQYFDKLLDWELHGTWVIKRRRETEELHERHALGSLLSVQDSGGSRRKVLAEAAATTGRG